MKKLIFLVAFAAFALGAYAQNVSLGAKAGLNVATISGDGTDGIDPIIAFHVGAVSEFPISEKFSIQPELLYSAQGAEDTADGMTVKAKLNYLNIPVMGKYYFTDAFSLEVGPQIGFLLKAEVEVDNVSVDAKDLFKNTDFGLNFGVGYKLNNGLNFSARYNLGLSNINDFDDEGEDLKNQNSVFQVSIGYFFL